MANINPIDQVVALIEGMGVEFLTDAELLIGVDSANLAEYLRFNPHVIIATMLAKAGSKEQLKKDAIALLALVIVRGTNYTDATIRMGETAKTLYNGLISKYGIKVDRPNKGRNDPNVAVNRISLAPETITMGRIASSFPQWASLIIAASPVGSPLRKWTGIASGLPYYLAFPQCLSLIPRDDQEMLGAARTFYKKFDETINRNIKEDEKTRDNRIDLFFGIIRDSPLLTDTQRRTLLTQLKNNYQNKAIAPAVNQAGSLRDVITKNINSFTNLQQGGGANNGNRGQAPAAGEVKVNDPAAAAAADDAKTQAIALFTPLLLDNPDLNMATKEEAKRNIVSQFALLGAPSGVYDVNTVSGVAKLPGEFTTKRAGNAFEFDRDANKGWFYQYNP